MDKSQNKNLLLTECNNWNSSDILHDGTENNWTNCIYYTETDHHIANLMDTQCTRHVCLEIYFKFLFFPSLQSINRFLHTCVKSAPMNACSIPIQTVINISNCWLGFLHWFNVAESNATPDNSFADSDPFRFSPYLKGSTKVFRKKNFPKRKEKTSSKCTLTMGPKTRQ